jgi:hypothetical protein
MKTLSLFLLILLAASCGSDRLPATETDNMYDTVYDDVDSVNRIETDSMPR